MEKLGWPRLSRASWNRDTFMSFCGSIYVKVHNIFGFRWTWSETQTFIKKKKKKSMHHATYRIVICWYYNMSFCISVYIFGLHECCVSAPCTRLTLQIKFLWRLIPAWQYTAVIPFMTVRYNWNLGVEAFRIRPCQHQQILFQHNMSILSSQTKQHSFRVKKDADLVI